MPLTQKQLDDYLDEGHLRADIDHFDRLDRAGGGNGGDEIAVFDGGGVEKDCVTIAEVPGPADDRNSQCDQANGDDRSTEQALDNAHTKQRFSLKLGLRRWRKAGW